MTTDIVVSVPRFTFVIIFYIVVDSRNNILKIFSFFLNIYILLLIFINVKKCKHFFTYDSISKTKLIYRVEKINKTYIRLFLHFTKK